MKERERTARAALGEGPARSRPSLERIETRFRGRAARAIANRRVFRYLAGATVVLSFLSGVTVWLIDRRDFHTLGDGLWWAIVTLATVGYGDIVPHTAWGRVVGSFVIVLGVTFLSLLTATVTSYFVAAEQADRATEAEARRNADQDDVEALLREVLRRLDAIDEHRGRDSDRP